MTNNEAIETLKVAKSEIEWEYPMDYQIALDKAIKALKQEPALDEKIKFDKQTKKWFAKNFSGQTTVMKCEKCGLFFKPSLGHKCKMEVEE